MGISGYIKYIIISPVRNEEKYIEKAFLSVISQTVKPVEWIIINDGSTDTTKEIIETYLNKFRWIKLINRPDKGHRAGAGPAEAFNEGLHYIKSDYDYLVNLDGDVSFEPQYFEKLFIEFEKYPKLGIASGKSYYLENGKPLLYRCANTSTMGPSKVYRKECFMDIGDKLANNICWDMIDDIKAQMKGWQTRSINSIKFIHYKRIGFKQGNTIKTQIKAGQILYSFGYHPLYMIGKSLYRIIDKPYVIGSLAMLWGYLLSLLKREQQIEDKEMMRFLQARQIEILTFKNIFKNNGR